MVDALTQSMLKQGSDSRNTVPSILNWRSGLVKGADGYLVERGEIRLSQTNMQIIDALAREDAS